MVQGVDRDPKEAGRHLGVMDMYVCYLEFGCGFLGTHVRTLSTLTVCTETVEGRRNIFVMIF